MSDVHRRKQQPMRTLHDLKFRIYNRALQRLSNQLFYPVLHTPPAKTNPRSDTILYTPLCRRDRRAYILAAKSVLRFCPNLRVVVQDDGSLDAASCLELQHHIDGIEILSLASTHALLRASGHPDLLTYIPDLFSPMLPTNLTILKLKLLNILYRYRMKRIFMIDSDIICCKPPRFILNWMTESQPSYFYGGGGNYQTDSFHQLGFDFTYADIADFNSGVMGIYHDIAEQELLNSLELIHSRNPGLLKGWEIEQSLWAVLLGPRANTTNLDRLQDGYICSGWKSYRRMKEKAVFVHFVGAIRFRNARYLRLAQDVYRELRDTQNTGLR
jgi:hypothetical protein